MLLSGPRWNPRASLRCLACGTRVELGPQWSGCSRCAADAPLVVAYETSSQPPATVAALAAAALPIEPGSVVDIGLQPTPLLVADPGTSGRGPMLLKVEGQNPTGSHKDRFHAIASAIARDLGAPGVVTASTGNHGAACAAHAAAAGLRCVVVLHPEATDEIRTQLLAYGAEVLDAAEHDASTVVAELVAEGFCPCTGGDHALLGYGNPYGQEGYKRIAFELVETLGDVPGAVAVPVASGDTVYGVWRGFRDLTEQLGLDMPVVVGCQPVGAAPLAKPLADVADRPLLEDPQSIALSTRDAHSGWHARHALDRDGLVATVDEADIAATVKALGRRGVFLEPASTLGVAAIERLRETGRLDPSRSAVALATSSGLNWSGHARRALELAGRERLEGSSPPL